MAFFKRRTAIPSTGHPGDDHLLSLIAKQSDLAAGRHWVHYLYTANEADARGAGQAIAAAGWQLTVDVAAKGSGWVVIAERQGAVTSPDAVRAAREFFEGVAARTPGGKYDGWEASL
jgi:hypothetical protein